MKSVYVAMCMLSAIFFFSGAARGETNATEEELGMNQKLERVYDLYRKGNIVSLKQDEVQVGVGLAYTTSSNTTLDVVQSSRNLTTQTLIGRGVGDGMEASISIPHIISTQRIETSNGAYANQTLSGFGDPSIRLIKMFPQRSMTMAAIFVTSIPAGNRDLSNDQVHTSLGFSLGKVLRPAFISGGLALERDWKSNTQGIGYNAGLGFFLNHALSAGIDVSGVAVLNPKPGMTRDVMSVGAKVAYQTDPSFGVVVSANFGVATNTPSATIGVSTYWRF